MKAKRRARPEKRPVESRDGEKRTFSARAGRARSEGRVEWAEGGEPLERAGARGRGELTDEEADRMVTEALDCELPEPEPFVRVLLLLYDLHEEGRGPELTDSIYRLMTAAYNNSNVHDKKFNDYLESVRKGQSLTV